MEAVLGVSENIIVSQAVNPGSVQVSFKTVDNAGNYRYQWALNPITADTVWQEMISTTRKQVISNLEPGSNYWFRVRAYDNKKQETVSSEVLEFVIVCSASNAA